MNEEYFKATEKSARKHLRLDEKKTCVSSRNSELRPCICGNHVEIKKIACAYEIKCERCGLLFPRTGEIEADQLRSIWNKYRSDSILNIEDFTEKDKANACMYFRHDYGLLDKKSQDDMMFVAGEWLKAWKKAIDDKMANHQKGRSE